MPEPYIHVFYGTVIHSASLTELEILPRAVLAVDSTTGTITALQPDVARSALPETLAALSLAHRPLTSLARGQLLVPGLVDTHNHAPQWSQRGLGQGMHILDWLQGITFPNEARFQDPSHAATVYAALVRGTLRRGTTTACYYASLHGEATRVLADTCLRLGQRALVGKCNMDRGSPDSYREPSAAASLRDTEACIAHIRAADPRGALVRPVLTPRFAISCTPPLLSGLGAIAAREPGLAIQTHFNEARQEMDATRALFPDRADEVDLYSSFGLLGARTVLAHCTVMSAGETARLAALGCGVAHCPTANMTVGGGFMAAPVRDFVRRGMRVGLGTDSGGGYSASVLDAMRHALVASFAREAAVPADKGLALEEVFYMATLGGARVVGFGDEVGRFDVGRQFDALVVDMRDERNGINAPLDDGDSARTIFDKFIMTGDDRNITDVFVRGKKVRCA